MIRAPDIVRQGDKVRLVLAAGLVIGQRRFQTPLVLIPDPASCRSAELCTAGSSVVEADVSIEVVWDLVGSVWDTIDEAGGEVLWVTSLLAKVDRSHGIGLRFVDGQTVDSYGGYECGG